LPRKQLFFSHHIHHLGDKALHLLLVFKKKKKNVYQNHVNTILSNYIYSMILGLHENPTPTLKHTGALYDI